MAEPLNKKDLWEYHKDFQRKDNCKKNIGRHKKKRKRWLQKVENDLDNIKLGGCWKVYIACPCGWPKSDHSVLEWEV